MAGSTAEQIFVFGHGTGSNGKGVLIHVMVAVLEGYTGRMEATFVCGSMPDPDSPTPTLLGLGAVERDRETVEQGWDGRPQKRKEKKGIHRAKSAGGVAGVASVARRENR